MRRALLLLALVPGLAWTEPGDPHAHHHAEPAAAPTVPPETYREFQAIESLVAQSAYAEAERKIQTLLPGLKANPAALALLLRNLANLHGMQQHYAPAADALRRALDTQALAPAEATQAWLELGQYEFAAERYDPAAQALSAWLERTPDPSPEPCLLLAETQAKLGRYAAAARLAELAIARSPQPKPEWYRFQVALYHAAHDLGACARALSALIDREPGNPLNWNQLIGVYQEAGQEGEALAVRQLMYKLGMLESSTDIVQLAQALRHRGLHSRAAELLQEEIGRDRVEADAAHLELLAESWTQAHELRKAVAVLERAAALADGGEVRYRLGQTYSELRDWPKARQALELALARGGLKHPGGARLLLGMAYYRLDRKDLARAAFLEARTEPGFRATAEQWLKHLDRDAQRDSH